MPVELTIVESVTELETTVVEVILESASTPGPAGPGVPAGGTDGQVLTKTSAVDYATAWEDPTGGGGGAPTDVDYLVGTANATLTNEIVVGTAPGGELGGTWAAPTVDATHSGSSHAAVQAAAEATAAAALSAHDADTTGVHGIADTSALALTANHPTNATFNDHSARHENGGADEISVAGLSGVLADAQTPSAHATAHADGGGDEIATALDARAYPMLADTLANRPAFGVAGRFFWTTDEGILYRDSGAAWVKVAVSDYPDLDDIPASFTPSAHAASHQDGGADEISIQGLAGTPVELTNHLNDAADAHDASAISVLDSGAFYTATDVEGVLAEIAPQLPAQALVATSVGALPDAPVNGQIAHLRLGSTPFQFIALVYDSTYNKWVGPECDLGLRVSSSAIQPLTTTQTSFTDLGGAEVSRGYIPNVKELYDSGLRLQVQWTVYISNSNAGATTTARLQFREFADGDTAAAEIFTSAEIATTGTTKVIKVSPWTEVTLTTAPLDAAGGCYVQVQGKVTANTGEFGFVFGHYRWVAAPA